MFMQNAETSVAGLTFGRQIEVRQLVEDPYFVALVYLVKNGMPFAEMQKLGLQERLAMCAIVKKMNTSGWEPPSSDWVSNLDS